MGRIFLWVSILLLSLYSCDSTGEYKLASSGLPGEVIVIIEDNYWNGKLGDTIRHHLQSYQEGLPQAEYLFNVGQYNHHNFSKIVKSHRNIMLFEFSSKYKEPKIQYLKDVWSTNQLVIKLMSNDPQASLELFDKEAEKIMEVINTRERERLIESSKELKYGEKISEILEKDHQLRLELPRDCEIGENKDSFVWITRERIRYVGGEAHDVDQGVFVYYYPYESDSTFTLDFLLMKRDSVLRANVPGPSEGSYMSTERHAVYYPVATPVSLNGEYAMEIRGLYKTVNDFYGGPFISLTTYDEKRRRIVTVDCFVFAPKFNKREYMREMEAVCYSLTFPNGKVD